MQQTKPPTVTERRQSAKRIQAKYNAMIAAIELQHRKIRNKTMRSSPTRGCEIEEYNYKPLVETLPKRKATIRRLRQEWNALVKAADANWEFANKRAVRKLNAIRELIDQLAKARDAQTVACHFTAHSAKELAHLRDVPSDKKLFQRMKALGLDVEAIKAAIPAI